MSSVLEIFILSRLYSSHLTRIWTGSLIIISSFCVCVPYLEPVLFSVFHPFLYITSLYMTTVMGDEKSLNYLPSYCET